MNYSKEYITELLNNNGYQVIGNIINLNTKVLCIDNQGYKYMITPSQVKYRGDKPNAFSCFNPYTIENINQWIINNNFSCKLISSEFTSAKSLLEWECECGQHYSAKWSNVWADKKHYCNYCAKSKRYDNLTDYQYLVQQECLKRNYYLIPNQNLTRGNDTFKYVCNKHTDKGELIGIVNNFVTDYGTGGCYYCGIEKRSITKRKQVNYFKEITERQGFIFRDVSYSDNDRTRIIYRCHRHYDKGDFSIYISNMKNSKGNCLYCMGQFRTQEDLQNEIDKLDLDIFILSYTSYGEPIECECKICRHIWKTKGVYLTQGVGCPHCSMSKFEKSVKKYLEENNYEYISQYKFDDCKDINPLPFDFYIPKKNTVIEVDGEGHYFPIKWSSEWSDIQTNNKFLTTKRHDDIKNKYCQNNNINIIRIPYWEKNNINNFMNSKLQTL